MQKKKKSGTPTTYLYDVPTVSLGKGQSFIARKHKKDLSNAIVDWIKQVTDNKKALFVDVSGLNMPQQRLVAKTIHENMDHAKRLQIKVGDGPYESSADMIERYIKRY